MTKTVMFIPDAHKYGSILIEPLHNTIVQHINPLCTKFTSDVLFHASST